MQLGRSFRNCLMQNGPTLFHQTHIGDVCSRTLDTHTLYAELSNSLQSSSRARHACANCLQTIDLDNELLGLRPDLRENVRHRGLALLWRVRVRTVNSSVTPRKDLACGLVPSFILNDTVSHGARAPDMTS